MQDENKMDKNMYKIIHEMLLDEWDPIGVQDIPEAQDEYDAYIHPTYDLIRSKKSTAEIFDYLWRVETENMGLPGNKKHTMLIASKLPKLSKNCKS